MALNIKSEHQDEWKNNFKSRLEIYSHCFKLVAYNIFPTFTQLNGTQAKVVNDITSEIMWNSDDFLRNNYPEEYEKNNYGVDEAKVREIAESAAKDAAAQVMIAYDTVIETSSEVNQNDDVGQNNSYQVFNL
jgi:hypothetical protein